MSRVWRASTHAWALACLVAVAPLGAAAVAQPAAVGAEPAALGAVVDELLAHARRFSPEIAAANLDSEAAAAKADAAGRLPDPSLSLFSDQNRNRNGGLVPSQFGNRTYTLQQTFPLWGKRDLQREMAQAEARQVGGKRRSVEAELAARIKAVFAEHYQARRATALTHDTHGLLHNLVQAAESRYAQGLGSQPDVLKAQLERGRLDAALIKLEGDARRAAARLNALVGRPADAALAPPRTLRAVPVEAALDLARLLERARRTSPMLAMQAADIDAADAGRRLVDRSWYPDLTAAVGAVDNDLGDRRALSYEAMLSINLPLSWGLREAQAHEASAKLGASRARRDAALVEIEGTLRQALAGLKATQHLAALLREATVPRSRVAVRSAMAAYQQGQGDLRMVIEAYHGLFEAELELLGTMVEEQMQLAEIERAIGEEL